MKSVKSSLSLKLCICLVKQCIYSSTECLVLFKEMPWSITMEWTFQLMTRTKTLVLTLTVLRNLWAVGGTGLVTCQTWTVCTLEVNTIPLLMESNGTNGMDTTTLWRQQRWCSDVHSTSTLLSIYYRVLQCSWNGFLFTFACEKMNL